MVGLCWALFGNRGAALAPEQAAASLARDVPGFSALRTGLGRDTRAALIDSGDGVYLALMRGDSLVTRKLKRGIAVTRDGERLRLAIGDFTLRAVELDLADASYWEERLRA